MLAAATVMTTTCCVFSGPLTIEGSLVLDRPITERPGWPPGKAVDVTRGRQHRPRFTEGLEDRGAHDVRCPLREGCSGVGDTQLSSRRSGRPRTSSLVIPSAIIATTVATRIRSPRRHGTPPI